MKYFFKNRKFGDILKTRDGRKVIFIAEYEPRYGDGEHSYLCWIEGYEKPIYYAIDGKLFNECYNEFDDGTIEDYPEDIISLYKEEIDEDKLEEMVEEKYPDGDESYCSFYDADEGRDAIREAYKEGYRDAKEE